MRKEFLVAVISFSAFAASACRLENDAPSASRAKLPTEAPSITGVVTDVGSDRRIRIEERPGESSGSAKAVVRLAADAAILTRAGSVASFDEIQNGMRVSAWFSGPVMESYPVQATARAIVIESGVP